MKNLSLRWVTANLKEMDHHKYERVAAQRPLAGVIDPVLARPFFHYKHQRSHSEIKSDKL